MGNSSSIRIEMKTCAVAQCMSLTQEQLLDLRDDCLRISSSKELTRAQFEYCMDTCFIEDQPDSEILDDLFTMWDVEGTDKVPMIDFLVSLSPLACKNDTFRSFLEFALDVHDAYGTGYLTPNELIQLLGSVNKTVQFLGDNIILEKKLRQIVRELVNTLNIIHRKTCLEIMHEDVVSVVSVDPIVRRMLGQRINRAHKVRFAPDVKLPSNDETNTVSVQSPRLIPSPRVYGTPVIPYCVAVDHDMPMQESELPLTPLTQLAINETAQMWSLDEENL